MPIEEVLPSVRMGAKARRRDWPDSKFIFQKGLELIESFNGVETQWEPKPSDIIQTDWITING